MAMLNNQMVTNQYDIQWMDGFSGEKLYAEAMVLDVFFH